MLVKLNQVTKILVEKKLKNWYFFSFFFIDSILGTEKIASDIENAQLNSSEIQQVIDILLAKQNEQEQWKKVNCSFIYLNKASLFI